MAITHVATASNTQANDNSIAISKPTGTVSGDVMLAFITTNDQDIDEPSGWSLLDTHTEEVFQSAVFYKVAGSFEGSNYQFRIDDDAPMVGTIVTYRGVDNTQPIGGVNWAVASDDSDPSEPVTTPTVSGNSETFGRVIYYRAARRSDVVVVTFSEASGTASEVADTGVYSGGSIVYSHGIFHDDADFSSGGSKSGLAITASLDQLTWITRTIILSAQGVSGGGSISAPAGLANAYGTAYRPIGEDDHDILTDETVPTYEIFVDWDNDGGLDFGNFEIGTDFWEGETSVTIVETSSDEVHLGRNNSLKITWDGSAGQNVWKYKQKLTPGNKYLYSAWVHVEGQAVRLTVDGIGSSSASTLTSDWEYLSVEFTATTETHVLQIEPTATPTNGDVTYMDQVMVTFEGEDITGRVLGLRSALQFQYGRDTNRSLSTIQPGETGITLDNSSRDYSPDNTDSSLYGMVRPGRQMIVRASFNGRTHTLFNGYLDEFTLVPTRSERAVEVGALDVLQRLNEASISTELFESLQTGQAIHKLLDAISWPTDKRDIDHGATTIRWWWENDSDAFEAMNKIVQSEGAPAISFVDSAGNFVFRDRHHRVIREPSRAVQATFVSGTNDKISYVGTGAPFSSTTSGTEFTLTKPDGVQGEDLYVATVCTEQDSTINAPSGWTVSRTLSINDGTDDLALFILIKDAESDDPDFWTGSVSVASTRRLARVVAYRGTAPAADQFIDEDGVTTASPTPATATPTLPAMVGVPGNWRLAVFASHDDAAGNSWGSYSLTSTERFDVQVGSSDPVLNVAYSDSGGTVAPTPSRSVTATYSGANLDTSAAWIGLLRPWSGSGLRFDVESFEYDIGWVDLVNSVSVTVEEREPTFEQFVFESEETYVLASGETREVAVDGSELFYKAVVPVEDTDYTLDTGNVTMSLSRDSGESTAIIIAASSASVVRGLRLRAIPVVAVREYVVKVEDSTSIANHGIHSLDSDLDVAWANRYDADSIAKALLGLRADRLPLITFRISNVNPERMVQILERDLSDRIHVVENETFTDHDFYIERIEQNIEEVGWNHSATFGCERAQPAVQDVFKFGTGGPGFDRGHFGVQGLDDPERVIILDQGRLDENVLGT